MTRYILHGGAKGGRTVENARFFRETVVNLPDPVHVLCVYYAKENKVQWPGLLEEDKIKFSSASPDRAFHFAMADEATRAFIGQIERSDVIYLRGGDPGLLQGCLEKVPGLRNLWKGKVIAGVSGGALVLSKSYYIKGYDACHQGLGMVPIKLFCHFTEDNSDKLYKLKEYGDLNDRIITLPEEEYVVIEQ